MYVLINRRVEVGPDEKIVLQEELKRLKEELALLEPKVEKDIKDSRERHRRLWNY